MLLDAGPSEYVFFGDTIGFHQAGAPALLLLYSCDNAGVHSFLVPAAETFLESLFTATPIAFVDDSVYRGFECSGVMYECSVVPQLFVSVQ